MQGPSGRETGREYLAGSYRPFELELGLIHTRMIQKLLLWVEVCKSACVLVGICELRLSPPARYDPQCPSLADSKRNVPLFFSWQNPIDRLRDAGAKPREEVDYSVVLINRAKRGIFTAL
jgi:hypothetical protein